MPPDRENLDAVTDRDPAHVVEVACDRFVGRVIERDVGQWVGDDVVLDGDSVVIRFHRSGSNQRLGARLPVPMLPREGIAYRGLRIRTAEDWLHDVVVTLQEEIATGEVLTGTQIPHDDWVEIALSFDPWQLPPSDEPLLEWTY